MKNEAIARAEKHYDAILLEWKKLGICKPRTRVITEVMHRMQRENLSGSPSRTTVAHWLKDYHTRDYYALCAALASERERLLRADAPSVPDHQQQHHF